MEYQNEQPDINELDPSKRNYVWANLNISRLRMIWRPLNNWLRTGHNRSVMFSMQEMQEVINSFDDEDFKSTVKMYPLPILEALVNAVVEEIVKKPPRCEIKSDDPSAKIMLQQDIEMLANKHIVESDVTTLRRRTGMNVPYKLPEEKFNSNVGEFDKMGLNSQDPDDLAFYRDNFQKLWVQIILQSIVDNVEKYNEFDEVTIRKLVKDVFALKTICTQCYVDAITGAIRYKYIDPAHCRGVFGETNDGKDDICRGWERSLTITEWLSFAGDDFNFEDRWRDMLSWINGSNQTTFTGFIRGGLEYSCFGNPDSMDYIGCAGVATASNLAWDLAYGYRINGGYIEWRTWECTGTMVKDAAGNPLRSISYNDQLSKKEISEGYQKESSYQQQWYRSYFVGSTSISQWIFGYQKIFHQLIEGANDEYANGTLSYWQEEGLSAVEIARPYLQAANFAFYRMLWIIYKAKPDAEEFIMEELLELAKNSKQFAPQQNGGASGTETLGNALTNMVKEMRKSHIRIRTFPTVEGRKVQQIIPIEKKGSGGLDPIAVAMQTVTGWAEQQITSKIGINLLRLGQAESQDGYKLSMAQTQYSMSTTGYMYRMVERLKKHNATSTLLYAQDIIKYKSSLPYKWLQTMISAEYVNGLKDLGKVAFFRAGIDVINADTEFDKQRILQAADAAIANGKISMSQWGIITQTRDHKKAFALLAKAENDTEKKMRQQQAELHDQQMQQIQAKNQGEMEVEKTKGEYSLERERIRANGFIASAQLQAEKGINLQELKDAAKGSQIEQQAAQDRANIAHQAKIDQQQPMAGAGAGAQ